MKFIEAFPAAASKPLTPLVVRTFTRSWHARMHQQRESFGDVHALGVWAADDILVTGHQSHLFQAGARIDDTSIAPRYVNELICAGTVDPGELLHLPPRIFEDPVVVIMGWGPTCLGMSWWRPRRRLPLPQRR